MVATTLNQGHRLLWLMRCSKYSVRAMYTCTAHNLDSHNVVLHDESNMSSYGDEILSPSYKVLPACCSDDDVTDDSSTSSTAVDGTPLDVEVPLRRSLSSSSVDGEFMKSQWNNEEEGSSDDGDHSDDGQLKEAMPLEELGHKPPHAGEHHRNNNSPEEHRRRSNWPEDYLIDAKHIKPAKSEKSPSRMDIRKEGNELKSSEGSPSHQRNYSKTSSKVSASSDESTSSERACLYSFEASHRGSLGISIEACGRGTIIHAVREHSPLFGLVEAGDKIVSVDGVDTRGMSTVVVAHLLGRKKGRFPKLHITVSRPPFGTAGIRTISMPKRFQKKSVGDIHLSPSDERGNVSSIDAHDSSVAELHKSTLTLENEGDDRDDNIFPFHFIGAGAQDDG